MSEAFPFAPPASQENRRIALICAKGGLDECYPVLIMANAACMVGIDTSIFFTFYGLDVVTDSRVDHLHMNIVGNPTSPIPLVMAGVPGMESLGSAMMRKKLDQLDVPPPREMIAQLHDSGARLYGCELAMKMFGRTQDDLLPQVQDVITATDFYDRTRGHDIVFI